MHYMSHITCTCTSFSLHLRCHFSAMLSPIYDQAAAIVHEEFSVSDVILDYDTSTTVKGGLLMGLLKSSFDGSSFWFQAPIQGWKECFSCSQKRL